MILDHLVIVAPTLEIGGDYVEARLGVRPWPGGRHNELGTHNLLLRIGHEVFLEVIAPDPESKHVGPLVFGIGLDNLENDWRANRRLKTFVCRTDNLARFAPDVGPLKSVTRGTRHWHMAIPPDGSLPFDGALPTPVQYESGMVPAVHMPDAGLELVRLLVEHPDPDRLKDLYRRMDVQGTVVMESGPVARMRAVIRCGHGEVEIS